MSYEFTPPEFVDGAEPEEIQQRMMDALPDGIDDMPGGFPYDFTMPTAIEKSELIQFHLVRTLMLMFPQYARGGGRYRAQVGRICQWIGNGYWRSGHCYSRRGNLLHRSNRLNAGP